ncbi:MAG: recombinase family protein [Pirellulaceae bacterium]|nr:recombinase family protein [Pirellulaceae bacterium]
MAPAIAYFEIAGQDDTDRCLRTQLRHHQNELEKYCLNYPLRLELQSIESDDGSCRATERLGLARLLGKITRDRTEAVVFYDLFGLGISDALLARLMAWLRDRNVLLHNVVSGGWLRDDRYRWKEEILKCSPQHRRSSLREMRQLISFSKTLLKADSPGRPRFGCTPQEQETLERMAALRRKPPKAKRLSYDKIAEILNQENRRTQQGGPWKGRTVRELIQRYRDDYQRT